MTTTTKTDPLTEQVLQSIRDSLHGLRYGQVTIIVQDGRVIQIDRMERHRFNNEEPPGRATEAVRTTRHKG
jgi:hypothetical protein